MDAVYLDPIEIEAVEVSSIFEKGDRGAEALVLWTPSNEHVSAQRHLAAQGGATRSGEAISSVQLLAALQHDHSRDEAKKTIDSKLAKNKVNRAMFWLIYGMQVRNARFVEEGYTHIWRAAWAFLSKTQKPLWKIDDAPDWEEVIHHTLFGNHRVTGQVEKYLSMQPEALFQAAQKNRFASILTVMGQRNIDLRRTHKFEHGPVPVVFQNTECGNDSEAIEAFEGQLNENAYDSVGIYDALGGWENIPDPSFGLPGLRSSGSETERIFQEPFAVTEWMEDLGGNMASEAGPGSKEAWVTLVNAIKDDTINLVDLPLKELRRQWLSLIARQHGVSKQTAAKRICQLSGCGALKQFLIEESRRGERHLPRLPRQVRVGRSQRARIGNDLFSSPDRRCTEPRPAAA